MQGRVTIQFTIASDGSVMHSHIHGTTMNDADVETCVGRQVCRWEFPKPKGGGIVIVTYPFSFTTSAPDAGAAPPHR
jgi:hypothetical protein